VEADDEGYIAWADMLGKEHPIRKAFDALTAKHKECGIDAKALQEKVGALQRQVSTLQSQADEHMACSDRFRTLQMDLQEWEDSHVDCESQHNQIVRLEARLEERQQTLVTLREEHKTCTGKIFALNGLIDNHAANKAKLSSLQQTAEKHKACEGMMRTMQEQLQAHETCEKTIESLEGQLEKATYVAELEKENADLRGEIAKVEKDFHEVCSTVATMYEDHVKRPDNKDIQSGYRLMASRLREWTCRDLLPTDKESTRKATFFDFLLSLVVNFEDLVMQHHEHFEESALVQANLEEMLKSVQELRADRDTWKRDCMAVVDKAESERDATQAREVRLALQIAELKKVLAEVQELQDERMGRSSR
jgi:chromosome segregation ATPase